MARDRLNRPCGLNAVLGVRCFGPFVNDTPPTWFEEICSRSTRVEIRLVQHRVIGAPLICQFLSVFFACSVFFRYPRGTHSLEQYIHYLAVHCHCFQCIFLRLLVFSIPDSVTQRYYWYSWWSNQESSSQTMAKYCSLLPLQNLLVAPYLNIIKTSVEQLISLNCKHTEKLVP